MHNVAQRYLRITERIRNAVHRSGRNLDSVRLVAVSKTVPTERVKSAIDAGVRILGENYVQEAREKCMTLSTEPVSWHFIGHLQTNKAKYAVQLFDLIHSVDSLKLARAIDNQCRKIAKVQNILIQVNIGAEPTKSGVITDDLFRLVEGISQFEHLSIKGLMTMPPFFYEPEKARPFFSALREMRDDINKAAIPGIVLDELSMGMTGDFEVAIEEGATLVRVGTAIFGERN